MALQLGATGSLTVTLDAVQATDTLIALTNSAPAQLDSPASAIVPAGRLSAEIPITGTALGAATVTAAAAAGKAPGVSAGIQIIQPLPKVVGVTPGAVTLAHGTPGVLHVTVSPAPTEPTIVSLTSSLRNVVEVPPTVTIPAGSPGADFPVATRQTGEASITASLNGGAASVLVTVTAAEVLSIWLSPLTPTIGVHERQPFRVTGTLTDGTLQDLTGRVVWRATDTAVATIATDGQATGVATGSTGITATVGTLTAKTQLTVSPLSGSLSLTPPAANVLIGETLALVVAVTPVPSQDLTISLTPAGTGTVTLTPSTVTIPAKQSSATVTVTPTGPGPVTVSATAAGRRTAESRLTVAGLPGQVAAPPGRPVIGVVLSAETGKPLGGIQLTLAGQSATTAWRS